MKLTLALLLTALLQVNASSFAQQVSLTEKRINLEQVFREIKRQTDYDIFYSLDMLQQTRPVSISVRNAPVREVLDICLRDQSLSYYIEGKTIIIQQKQRTQAPATIVRQSQVSGQVLDQSRSPIPGVNVRVKSSQTGVATDGDGRFRLAAASGSVLVFTSIGYLQKEVTLSGQTDLEVVMNEDQQVLNDVVVVGYGTQRRSQVSGAVDQIRAAQIEDRPVGNVMQALQGTAPSLVIQQRSMNPNDNTMNINLRGISTFNNNSPLLVIDGIINEDVGAMNNLNPNDIESVSILKDAGSAAIYGSRSANGVILITTKKGKKGMKPTVRLSALAGSQNPEILVEPLKGYQNALLRNDSYVNTGANPIYSSEQIRQFATGDSEYFLKGILKNGFQQNHNISVQGGSDNSTYLVSLGYYDQRSNFKGPDFGLRRYNLRTNLTTEIGKLKLAAIMWYDRSEGRSFQGDNGFLIANASRLPVYNNYILKGENGRYYNNDVLTNGNPLLDLEQGGFNEQNNDHFQGSLNAEIQIFKGLKARGIASLDLRPENRLIRRFYYPLYNLSGDETPVNAQNSNNYSIEDYTGKSTLLNLQGILDYNRSFGGHNVYGLAGFSNESYRQRRFELKRQLVDPILGIPIEGSILDPTSYNTVGGTTERSIQSYFGRVGYSYADKYLMEANFRYDGSTRFARANRWGFFPSLSLGWRISEESFFKFWKDQVGDLKIRGSYGQLGNQNVPDYQTFTTYVIYPNQYGFNNSPVPGTGYTFGNPALQWETNTTFNIGADATFLSGKLTAGFDYFRKNTEDILLNPNTPLVLGGAVPQANLGAMVNNGWELTVNYQLRHSDFVHNFGLNLADSWNKVTRFEGDEQISKADEIERIIRVGLPLQSYYGYKRAGLFRNMDEIKESALPIGVSPSPGDVKYVDRNGDGIIDDNDRFVLGHAFPRLTFGFNYDIQWKGFDLNMLWQGVGKRDMALRGETIEPFHGGYSFVMFEHQLDYWTPNNPDARWPRLTAPSTASTINNYGKGSDFNIFDGSYIRLKNIQLGYTLPGNISTKAGMRKVRFFVSGQNLLTFSKNTFIDPESSEFGSNMNASGANSARNYPLLKYVGGGLDIEF